jgi:hypothetical protein
MDAPQFDALSKGFSAGETRRRVVGALATAPVLGGFASLLSRDEADARKRRADHQHDDGHGVDAEKKKRKKKKKKKCKPDATSVTCNGKCGNVLNNCKQTVNCGSCACKPSCAGKCSGGDDGCGGTCTGDCSANQICDGGVCHTCDICPSGCTFDNFREAVGDASPGDTLYVCAGTYTRFDQGNGEVFSTEMDLTVIGAGSSEDGGTILDGGGNDSVAVVVEIIGATVELRSLRITGGKHVGDIGGGMRIRASKVTLNDVTVIENSSSVAGGGISNESDSSLTLKNSTVTENTAPNGAGILNSGKVIFAEGNDVSGNTTGDCVNIVNGTGCPA